MMSRRGFNNPSAAASRNSSYDKTVLDIDKMFTDARAYRLMDQPENTNLKLEAMKGLFDGTKTLFIKAGGVKEIMESVNFAKKHLVKKIVLVGVDEDILKITEFIKENDVPVIVSPLMRTPKREDGDQKIQYKIPHLLNNEGILIGLGLPSPTGGFNLPFMAGAASAYGMDKEEALKTVTSNMARILGVENRTGTIEAGMDANIIISTGDLLDIKTSNVEIAFINGRQIDLDNKHKRLYNKYKEKYDKLR